MTDHLNDKNFCLAPWVHIHAYPNGRAYPCCLADFHEPIGNLRDNTMEEVWNNEGYRQLRKNMMENKPSSVCKKCYEHEANGLFSQRQSMNRSHGKYVDEVELTHEDGYHPEFKIRYWDVRFSNLCNFSCRSCGPVFSSNWFKEHVKMYGGKPSIDGKELAVIEYAGRSKHDIWDQMQAHLPYIDQIYFAGGEPLLMEEHYKILEKLIELGRTDINLQYNTNFSELKYKSKDVLELWKHFPKVSVGASLDASGARAELMRKGTVWRDIVKNRQRMIETVPHVDFYIAATVSLMNVIHVMDFHREWAEIGLIKPSDFNVNVLLGPDYYRVDALPVGFKHSVVAPAIERHLEWLAPLDTVTRATGGYRGLLTMMLATDNSRHLSEFLRVTKDLDNARDEKFWNTFPELLPINPANTMCILPWVGLETSPVGTARPCCLAEEEIPGEDGRFIRVADKPLIDIANSNYMRWMRASFKAGEKPATCAKCWKEEAAGRTSKRQHTLNKFKHRLKDVDIANNTVTNLWYLDLKLGNICNLKCRICGSWSSSKWAGEEIDYLKQTGASRDQIQRHTAYKMLKEGAWPRKAETFWASVETLLPNIEVLEFTGGEPFLIEEHYDLLERAVAAGHAGHIALHYNTNGTVYSDRLTALWPHFASVEIAFSIDNTGARFEYERYGAKWDEVTTNIDRYVALRAASSNITLQLCFTVNTLNVLYLHQLVAWADTVGFDNYHWNMLHGPEEMSIACLPVKYGEMVKEVLRHQPWAAEYQREVDGVIAMVSSGAAFSLISELHAKLAKTDLYRGQDLSTTHPALAKIINYAKT